VLIGWAVAKRKTPLTIAGAAFASSILFFVLTNFGMWLFSGLYPLTLEGLVACYVAAIPFFQNTVAGDLFFTALLFGGFALAERLLPALRPQRRARRPPETLVGCKSRPHHIRRRDPFRLVGNQPISRN
jgi:hypothetical protein